MEDINARDLVEETSQTLDGSEEFVMFDPYEGKRGSIGVVGSYILQHGDADGGGNTLGQLLNQKADADDVGDIDNLSTTEKSSVVGAVNELNDKVSLISVDNGEKDCFGNQRQRVCQFYDVFYRDDTSGFGDNGAVMTWNQEYAEYVSIVSHQLVFSGLPGARPFYISKEDMGDDFALEVAIDKTNTDYNTLVFCGKDRTNYYYVRCRIYGSYTCDIQVYKDINGTNTNITGRTVSIQENEFHVITAHYQNEALYIYVDGEFFLKTNIPITWTDRKVGLLGIKNTDLKYSSFSVFTFRDFVEYDTDAIDHGYKEPFTTIIPDGTQNYALVNSELSPKAESHSLYMSEVTTNTDARCETQYHNYEHQTPLAHIKVEFDKKFESPFVPDTKYDEAIFQLHGRNSLSPSTTVNVHGLELQVRAVGSSDRNEVGYPTASVVSIGTATAGWHHFKLDICLGCSKYHRPRIDVYVDGVYAGTTLDVNQYCDDLGPYIRYGIYKWDWETHKDGDVTERHYLTDNVKIIY